MELLSECPKRAEQTACRVIDQQAVVVIPGEGLVRVLNQPGSRIWQLLNGTNSLAEISRIISREFDVSTQQARQDTLEFIRELQQKQMLAES